MVWDEASKEWRPRYGYKSVKKGDGTAPEDWVRLPVVLRCVFWALFRTSSHLIAPAQQLISLDT